MRWQVLGGPNSLFMRVLLEAKLLDGQFRRSGV